jgi:oligopeptide transport system ATP-binding protein
MYAGRMVETAPTGAIFKHPKHPYNRALQKAIPALQPKGADLYTIPGMPPDLSKPAPGCAFAPRCEFAEDSCRAGNVELQEIEPGHRSACLRVQNGSLKL